MKGLMLIAVPIDTERGDTALALRRALAITEALGVQEDRQAQVVAKETYEGPPGTLPDDFDEHPGKYGTANTFHELEALGFDPRELGLDVVSESPTS